MNRDRTYLSNAPALLIKDVLTEVKQGGKSLIGLRIAPAEAFYFFLSRSAPEPIKMQMLAGVAASPSAGRRTAADRNTNMSAR